MDLTGFGVANTLTAMLNSRTRDSNYAIAEYLVQRIREVKEISVQDIMGGAFVSRSAVRRFCNQLGYGGWSDLQDRFSDNVFPSDLRHRNMGLPLEDYKKDLDGLLLAMSRNMEGSFSLEIIEDLAQEICESNHIVFVCPSNTIGVLLRFQEEMLFTGKYVELVSDVYSNRSVDMRDGSDVLVVMVSVSGLFARSANEWIGAQSGRKILVTAGKSDWFEDAYDAIYQIGGGILEQDELGVFCKYGIAYFFDLLSACCMNRLTRGA